MDTYTTKPAIGEPGTLLYHGDKLTAVFCADDHQEAAELTAMLLNGSMEIAVKTTEDDDDEPHSVHEQANPWPTRGRVAPPPPFQRAPGLR